MNAGAVRPAEISTRTAGPSPRYIRGPVLGVVWSKTVRAVAAVLLLLSLALVVQASAARLPKASEAAALTRATAAYIHRDPSAARIRFESIRVSTFDSHWAVVVADVWDSAGRQIQGATFVWHTNGAW